MNLMNSSMTYSYDFLFPQKKHFDIFTRLIANFVKRQQGNFLTFLFKFGIANDVHGLPNVILTIRASCFN